VDHAAAGASAGADGPPALAITGLRLERDGHVVLAGVDLDVPRGTITAILGASGAGKSSLLRCVAGLDRSTVGSVRIAGEDVTGRPAGERDLAMVMQDAPLDPTRSIRRNLAFPLRVRKMRAPEIDRRVNAEARAFGLRDLLARLPAALSEGERHTAALARGLVRLPALMLLDEPLADLDTPARRHAQEQIAMLSRGAGATLLVATNDQALAASLADEVALLDGGVVAQCGPYQDLYRDPRTTAVAALVGAQSMVLLDGEVARWEGDVVLRTPGLTVVAGGRGSGSLQQRPGGLDPRALARLVGRRVVLGLRPEDLTPATTAAEADVRGVVRQIAFLGGDGIVHVDVGAGPLLAARVSRPLPRRGDVLPLRAGRVHLFDDDGHLVGTLER